jgi:esterase/lipase superfamily enzyme
MAGCVALPLADQRSCALSAGTSAGQPQLTVYFATNRAPIENEQGSVAFGYDRSDSLVFGKAVVILPSDADRPIGSLAGTRIAELTTMRDPQLFASALKSQQQRSQKKRDALVYIHGYNNSFERSIIRAAQFVHDGCLDVVPVVFSWPSRNAALDRDYDLDSATFSRAAAAEVLARVRDDSGGTQTHILAHSMGNWIAVEALGILSKSKRGKAALGAVILASPDVDLDVFRQRLPQVRASARAVALLTSRNDLILRLSQFLTHDTRAGEATNEELVAHGITNDGNFVIVRMDTADVGYCPGAGHRCATANQVVLEKIAAFLRRNGDIEPQSTSDSNRIFGLGGL